MSEIDVPANLVDIRNLSQTWPRKDLKSKIALAGCSCCAMTVSNQTSLKICNKVIQDNSCNHFAAVLMVFSPRHDTIAESHMLCLGLQHPVS